MKTYRLAIAGALTLLAWVSGGGAEGSSVERNWGVRWVNIDECPVAHATGSWWKVSEPGIGVVKEVSWGLTSRYTAGWLARDGDGVGIAGLLKQEFSTDDSVTVQSYGRRGDVIRIVLAVAEREPRTPTKRVLFSALFPTDLPAGKYQVQVELQDQRGVLRERYSTTVTSPPVPDPIHQMDDAQLLAEYVRRGEALRDTGTEPVDGRGRLAAAFPYESPPSQAWKVTQAELVARGQRVVPAMMAMLEREAVRNPEEPPALDESSARSLPEEKLGFAFNLMELLCQIDDPRPAPLLVKILAGMEGRANRAVRGEARVRLELLTHISFVVDKDNPPSGFAMQAAQPLVISFGNFGKDWDASFKTTADRYSKWLASEEGRDPSQWIPSARKRAREAMAGDDPLAIRAAVAFLANRWVPRGFDDDRLQTAAAAARLLDRAAQIPKLQTADLQGRLLNAIAVAGPAARPHVQRLIAKDDTQTSWDAFWRLSLVGGEEAMTHLVRTLPALRTRVRDAGTTPEVDLEKSSGISMEARYAVVAYRACRWAIERWSGRVFASDAEIDAWWATAKSRTQRDWLTDALIPTAKAADAGDAKAQRLIRDIVPDLPHAGDDEHFDVPWQTHIAPRFKEQRPGAYRIPWLNEHRATLVYDEQQSCYRLPK